MFTDGVVGGAMLILNGAELPVFGVMQGMFAVTVTVKTSVAVKEDELYVSELPPTGIPFNFH